MRSQFRLVMIREGRLYAEDKITMYTRRYWCEWARRYGSVAQVWQENSSGAHRII